MPARRREVTLSKKTAETNLDEVIGAMLGSRRDKIDRAATPARDTDFGTEPKLTVRDLHVGDQAQGVSFDLHKGEILGIAGLVGSGRSTLMRTLFGDVRPQAGRDHPQRQAVPAQVARPTRSWRRST